jgi:hypothetical protein
MLAKALLAVDQRIGLDGIELVERLKGSFGEVVD